MVTAKHRRRKMPPGIRARRNSDGSVSFDAQLLVKPFPRAFKSHETLEAAIQWRKSLATELAKQRQVGGVRTDLAQLSIAALNAEYLKDPETAALKTAKDRTKHLAWWSVKFGNVKILDFGVLHGRQARDALVPRMMPASVNRFLASQRAAWNWGRAAGLIPADRIWPPRLMLTEPKARVRYLDDEELQRVLEAARSHSPVLNAAVTVALACGCRAGEQMRLEWKDIDFPRSTITLLETKNGHARAVHLPAIAAEALKALKASAVVSAKHPFVNRYGKRLTTQGLDRQWRLVRTAAQLKNFRWHDLRHSCASFLAQNGASLPEIGSVLGHSSPSITAKYSHLVAGKAVTGHAALDSKLRGAT
jgi:integrase